MYRWGEDSTELRTHHVTSTPAVDRTEYESCSPAAWPFILATAVDPCCPPFYEGRAVLGGVTGDGWNGWISTLTMNPGKSRQPVKSPRAKAGTRASSAPLNAAIACSRIGLCQQCIHELMIPSQVGESSPGPGSCKRSGAHSPSRCPWTGLRSL